MGEASAATRGPQPASARAGDGNRPTLQPGLLVIQVESVQQQGYISGEGGTTTDEEEEEGSGDVNDQEKGEEEGQEGEMSEGQECQEEEFGVGQGNDPSDSELAAAAAQAAPAWHPQLPNDLLLQLPFRVARRFSTVALELGSVLLPGWVTGELDMKPHGVGASHTKVVIRRQLGEFMRGAELLPCKAVPSAAEAPGRVRLVLRAAWPPAAPGQLVSPTTCISLL
jgi:hypothetical protein